MLTMCMPTKKTKKMSRTTEGMRGTQGWGPGSPFPLFILDCIAFSLSSSRPREEQQTFNFCTKLSLPTSSSSPSCLTADDTISDTGVAFGRPSSSLRNPAFETRFAIAVHDLAPPLPRAPKPRTGAKTRNNYVGSLLSWSELADLFLCDSTISLTVPWVLRDQLRFLQVSVLRLVL
jgi:hypothetical protein